MNSLFIISLSPLVIVYCPYHLLSGSGGQYQAHCSNKGRRPQCQGCLQRLPLRAATCNTNTKKKSKCNAENIWNSPHLPFPLLHPSRRILHFNNLDARKNSPKLLDHLISYFTTSLQFTKPLLESNKSSQVRQPFLGSNNISTSQSHFILFTMSFQQSRESVFSHGYTVINQALIRTTLVCSTLSVWFSVKCNKAQRSRHSAMLIPKY